MERIDKNERFSFWPGEKPSKMPAQRVKELFEQAYADPDPGILSLTMALLTEQEWQEYAESLLRDSS